MPTLDLTPQQVDLRLQVGDVRKFVMQFWTDDTKTQTLDVSSYTGWVSTIKATNGQTCALTIDLASAAVGQVTFTIPGGNLRNMPPKGIKWDASANVAGDPITLAEGRVTLKQDVSP